MSDLFTETVSKPDRDLLRVLMFDASFPETFNWAALDSRIASDLGERLAVRIKEDLGRKEMNNVPGMRQALILLAWIIQSG